MHGDGESIGCGRRSCGLPSRWRRWRRGGRRRPSSRRISGPRSPTSGPPARPRRSTRPSNGFSPSTPASSRCGPWCGPAAPTTPTCPAAVRCCPAAIPTASSTGPSPGSRPSTTLPNAIRCGSICTAASAGPVATRPRGGATRSVTPATTPSSCSPSRGARPCGGRRARSRTSPASSTTSSGPTTSTRTRSTCWGCRTGAPGRSTTRSRPPRRGPGSCRSTATRPCSPAPRPPPTGRCTSPTCGTSRSSPSTAARTGCTRSRRWCPSCSSS